jgi:two-component system, OmpR family, KDP operon response regulator KdpE
MALLAKLRRKSAFANGEGRRMRAAGVKIERIYDRKDLIETTTKTVLAELLARAEAALRRYYKTATESPIVVAGPLSIDLVGRTVSLNDKQIKLTRKEYRLLHILATHIGLVVTHDQLLKEIWSGNQRENIQYLRILVRKLRQKIETDPNDPRLLVTESGVGYRLQARPEYCSAD